MAGMDPGAYAPSMPDKDARMWATLCHLAGFLGLLGIPLANVIGPFVIWLLKREQHPFIDDQGKEALNFQITMLIAGLICALMILIVIGVFLLIALGIFAIIVMIMAAIKANAGEYYRYPICIRFIK
jgi:uncharacterized Tic20 family protein